MNDWSGNSGQEGYYSGKNSRKRSRNLAGALVAEIEITAVTASAAMTSVGALYHRITCPSLKPSLG